MSKKRPETSFAATGKAAWAKRFTFGLVLLPSFGFIAQPSFVEAQEMPVVALPVSVQPVSFSPSLPGGSVIYPDAIGDAVPLIHLNDVDFANTYGVAAQMAQSTETGAKSDAAPVASSTSQNEASQPSQTSEKTIQPAQDGEAMPPSLTNPVLPNVPSAVKKDDLLQPENKLAPVITMKEETTSNAQPEEPAKAAAAQTEASAPVRQGPKLRQSFSVLFTEQRPFLLYSQDSSITYLMPNAVVDHPALGRYLRDILENRALASWQDVRSAVEASTDLNEERPITVITGRVEDRFSSPDFASLYLREQKSKGDQQSPDRILSFNYSYQDSQPFGLRDIFNSSDDKSIAATVDLIAAYIQADIVRQKSIRLGTQISLEQDAWLKDLKPTLDLLDTFTLVPSRVSEKIAGLAFHFNPGLLGAEADGSYNVYVPASIFAPSLSARFADMFGGEALVANRHTAKGFSTASVNIDGLRANAELGGEMLIEGEVPGNWCDGFHMTLMDKSTSQIITEGIVQMLPELPTYGLSGGMMRFRSELVVSGGGGKEGLLVFEPYPVETDGERLVLRPNSACSADRSIALPDPNRDEISIPVIY